MAQEAQSPATPPRSRPQMQLVGEQRTPEPLSSLIGQNPATPTTTATTPPSLTGEFVHRAAWKAGVLGALNALFVIVAVRAILLVAIIGAIYLALTVIAAPDPWRLGALAIYAMIVAALIWLSSRR